MSIIMPTASHQAKPTEPPSVPMINTRYANPDGSIVGFGADFLGSGSSAFVFRHGNNALKIPQVRVTTDLPAKERRHMESINDLNKDFLMNEKRIYEILGQHIGVVSCSELSADGILMPYFKNGDLEQYLRKHQPVADDLKVAWLRSLVDTLCYIHGRGVFVNDIAPRNILVDDDLSLRFADFGSSTLNTDAPELELHGQPASSGPLPITTTPQDRCDDSAVDRDMFDFAFVMYSIVVWKLHVYNEYFSPTIISSSDQCKNAGFKSRWPSLEDLPSTEGALYGEIIRKCWTRAYRSIWEVRDEIYAAVSPPIIEGEAS